MTFPRIVQSMHELTSPRVDWMRMCCTMYVCNTNCPPRSLLHCELSSAVFYFILHLFNASVAHLYGMARCYACMLL